MNRIALWVLITLNIVTNGAVIWYLHRNLQMMKVTACLMGGENMFECMKGIGL